MNIERIKLDGDRWSAELAFAPLAFDPEYWLSRSEGFLVDSPQGVVGVVDEVVRTAEGRVRFLVVGGGWFGRRRYLVPRNDVEEIRPGPQRLLVRAAGLRPSRSPVAARFPFNVLSRAAPRVEKRQHRPSSEYRSVEMKSEAEVVELLGIEVGG
ncbi:MAG: PRC-barrel domain-containing protein [Actinomycetota bacterium]|nr:PRC-barrel domain-containing protein [Actinomycetota bacterium]